MADDKHVAGVDPARPSIEPGSDRLGVFRREPYLAYFALSIVYLGGLAWAAFVFLDRATRVNRPARPGSTFREGDIGGRLGA